MSEKRLRSKSPQSKTAEAFVPTSGRQPAAQRRAFLADGAKKPKLVQQLSQALRSRHYSRRTEQT